MRTRLLERWQRLSIQQRRMVMVIGAGTVAWAVYMVGLRPLQLHLGKLRRQVRAIEERLMRAVAVNAKAESILRAYEAYRSYVPSAQSKETDLAKVQSQVQSEVETAVRASGMSLLNVKPSPQTAQTQSPVVSVMIEAEASPEQLVKLLDLIQRSTQLLKVTQLILRAAEENGSTLRCSLVISKLLL